MTGKKIIRRPRIGLAFAVTFGATMLMFAGLGSTLPAGAFSEPTPVPQVEGYAGPDSCGVCHDNKHEIWSTTRHAQAFVSPVFQQDWQNLGSQVTCLECHTTGYNPATGTYSFEGVTCESCHGPFQTGHPGVRMPVTPNAELCSDCHKNTTDEWQASKHGQENIVCEACHDSHSQQLKADSVTELCGSCHRDRGESFTHGSHSSAGLECSTCHMFTNPRTGNPIEGLVPTGHTFSVGSDACIGCHQDTVHTRDVIISLRGQVEELSELDPDELRLIVQEQEEQINNLKSISTVRLYTGLAQGAIVGLATGSVVAWIVSQRIEYVEAEEDEDEQEES